MINAVVALIEVALAIRIFLELFGASTSSAFVAWIYGVTAAIVGPFAGAFQNIAMGPSATLDLAAILAMIGYALLSWLLIRVLLFILSRLTPQ